MVVGLVAIVVVDATMGLLDVTRVVHHSNELGVKSIAQLSTQRDEDNTKRK